MRLSAHDRAAARRYHKLGKEAGKNNRELFEEIGRKLFISKTTAYRVIINKGWYNDDLHEDERILKACGHVDWDMDNSEIEEESWTRDPLFQKRGTTLVSRCDRAIIRRCFKEEYTGSKPTILYRKIARSYGVHWSTISKVVRNVRYGDNLDDDEMCLRKYEEMQTRVGEVNRSDGSGHVDSDAACAGPSNSSAAQRRTWTKAAEIPVRKANKSVRGSLKERSLRTRNDNTHPEPAGSSTQRNSVGRRISSRRGPTPITVQSRPRPSTRSQNRLQHTTNRDNEFATVHPSTSRNQPLDTNVESFLKSINLGHLVPLFQQEGFSTPEILSKLRSCSVDMQSNILKDFRDEYGLKFRLADKFVLGLELKGLGTLID